MNDAKIFVLCLIAVLCFVAGWWSKNAENEQDISGAVGFALLLFFAGLPGVCGLIALLKVLVAAL